MKRWCTEVAENELPSLNFPISSLPFASAKENVLHGTNERGSLHTLDSIKTAPRNTPSPKMEADIHGEAS